MLRLAAGVQRQFEFALPVCVGGVRRDVAGQQGLGLDAGGSYFAHAQARRQAGGELFHQLPAPGRRRFQQALPGLQALAVAADIEQVMVDALQPALDLLELLHA